MLMLFQRYQFAIIALFWTITWSIKASFLVLYWRLFEGLTADRKILLMVAAFTVASYVSASLLIATDLCETDAAASRLAAGSPAFGHAIHRAHTSILVCQRDTQKSLNDADRRSPRSHRPVHEADRCQRVDNLNLLQHSSRHPHRPSHHGPTNPHDQAATSRQTPKGRPRRHLQRRFRESQHPITRCHRKADPPTQIIIAVSLVRLTQIIATARADPVGLAVWGLVESSIAVIVGSLPPLKAFLTRTISRTLVRSKGASGGNSRGKFNFDLQEEQSLSNARARAESIPLEDRSVEGEGSLSLSQEYRGKGAEGQVVGVKEYY